jgi:Prokaryotic membrane lipoprotein lipid attachment site
MKKTIFAIVAALVLTGCTSVAPGAEKVVLTRNPKDVTNCKVIGPVQTPKRNDVGLGGGAQADKAMKNAGFAAGGDTVFVTSAFYAHTGVAYNCSGIDQRMPATVIVKPQ